METIKHTISTHDDSLFNERTGKLQTGLTCHHKFNSDTLHLISTGIQDNIAQLIEDIETASKKPKATYSLGSKTNVSKSRRKKEDKRKARKRSSLAVENRKSRASVIFLSLGETPVDEYEPEKYGVPQIDNVDLDVLGLFTSRTDKACLGDLLNSKCFIGEAEELVEEFLSSTS